MTVTTQANSALMILNEKVKPLHGSSVAEILNFKIFHILNSSNEDSTYKVNLFLTIAIIYKSAIIEQEAIASKLFIDIDVIIICIII